MARVQQDPDCYPGTDILENLAGLRDQAKLDMFEAQMVAFRLALLARSPITGVFDESRLRTTHRLLFGGVYRWAGEFRRLPGLMTKRRESGAIIIYGESVNITRELARVFRALTKEHELTGLGVGEFAQRAAYFYSEIDAIHPFRDGNSRTLRQFLKDLAKRAGHRFDWSAIAADGAARDRLCAARDTAVLQGDTIDLAEIFGQALSGIDPA